MAVKVIHLARAGCQDKLDVCGVPSFPVFQLSVNELRPNPVGDLALERELVTQASIARSSLQPLVDENSQPHSRGVVTENSSHLEQTIGSNLMI